MQQAPKRIGQGMWIAAWVVFLGLLYLFFEEQVTQKFDPNHDLQVSDNRQPVVLKRNKTGHYIAPGEINGKPVIFLLDTGATSVSVPQTVAQRIGLGRGYPRQVSTANGVIEVYASELDSVQLGSIKLHNINGHINPYMDGDTVLLGMSFMRHLEITQRGDTLTLKP